MTTVGEDGGWMNRRLMVGCGCAALGSTALAAPPESQPKFLPLKTPVEIPLASLATPWTPVEFKARFTKSNGDDSLAPGIAVRTATGVKAFCAYCPHELCVIKLNDAHQLRCPCHFSLFDPQRDGAWITGPAARRTYRLRYADTDRALVVSGIEADLERRLS